MTTTQPTLDERARRIRYGRSVKSSPLFVRLVGTCRPCGAPVPVYRPKRRPGVPPEICCDCLAGVFR